MTFVLSIIAQKPSSTSAAPARPPLTGSLPAGPVSRASTPLDAAIGDGNQAIEDIVAMMDKAKAKLPYTAVTARATYVRDIAETLSDLQNRKQIPDIIQLVAHGSAGRLEFGSYWGQKLLDYRQGAAVLDSNPDSYGLLQGLITAGSSVFLLGCHVGSASPRGYVASGQALLFDLEDMTKANFYAAPELVYPALFRDNFLYRGPLVTKDGKPANPAAIVDAQPSPPGPIDRKDGPFSPPPLAPQVPQLVRLVSAPALGQRDAATIGRLKIPEAFSGYVSTTPPGRLLAMAELVFEATNYRRVEAICGLRYLRAETTDGETKYFEHPSASTDSSTGRRYTPPDFAKPIMENLQANNPTM